jgi:hypothetical protein
MVKICIKATIGIKGRDPSFLAGGCAIHAITGIFRGGTGLREFASFCFLAPACFKP